jgi:anti-sigma regulatory factor (Ser/Thr protein kinase)
MSADDRVAEHVGTAAEMGPAEAREAVRGVVRRMRDRGDPCGEESLFDALLVASELTTNAMLHGGGITEFAVRPVPHGVRVTVGDHSDHPPVARRHDDTVGRWQAGGHGWPIVCRLSREVRVSPNPSGGKRVTADVPLFAEHGARYRTGTTAGERRPAATVKHPHGGTAGETGEWRPDRGTRGQ